MGELSKLPNIGPVVEKQLIEVGINTFEELKEIGSKEAWLKIQAIDSSACINRLCGLGGALYGVRWHSLPKEVKEDLKAFYNQNKL